MYLNTLDEALSRMIDRYSLNEDAPQENTPQHQVQQPADMVSGADLSSMMKRSEIVMMLKGNSILHQLKNGISYYIAFKNDNYSKEGCKSILQLLKQLFIEVDYFTYQNNYIYFVMTGKQKDIGNGDVDLSKLDVNNLRPVPHNYSAESLKPHHSQAITAVKMMAAKGITGINQIAGGNQAQQQGGMTNTGSKGVRESYDDLTESALTEENNREKAYKLRLEKEKLLKQYYNTNDPRYYKLEQDLKDDTITYDADAAKGIKDRAEQEIKNAKKNGLNYKTQDNYDTYTQLNKEQKDRYMNRVKGATKGGVHDIINAKGTDKNSNLSQQQLKQLLQAKQNGQNIQMQNRQANEALYDNETIYEGIYRDEFGKNLNSTEELKNAFYNVIRLLNKYGIDTKQTIDASNAAYRDIMRQDYGKLN